MVFSASQYLKEKKGAARVPASVLGKIYHIFFLLFRAGEKVFSVSQYIKRKRCDSSSSFSSWKNGSGGSGFGSWKNVWFRFPVPSDTCF